MSNFSRKVLSGTAWISLSTIVTSIVQILRLSILSRFLAVSDFGVVALLTVILGLTNTFADLGFSVAVMHKERLGRDEFCSLYWIQFALYIVIYGLIACISPAIASFYSEPSLEVLIPVILLELLFYGIGKLYDTLLQKELQFKVIAVRNIVTASISLALAVVMAIKGAGVYSLVFSTIFNALMLNIWNLCSGQKYIKLKFAFDVKSNMDLIKIGLFQTGTQILDYLSSRLDIIILGKVLGTSDLGIYNLAKELITRMFNVVNSIVNKVMLPFFSKFQNDIQRVQDYYCKLLMTLSFVNYFIFLIICIASKPIVNIIYGTDYLSVAPILSILSIWGMLTCIGNPVGNIVVAFGRTDLSFKYTLLRIAIFVPCIYLFSKLGLKPMAIGQIALGLVSLQLTWQIILRPVIHIRWKKWAYTYGPMLIIAGLLGFAGYYLNEKFINDGMNLLSINIISVVLISALVYFACSWFIYKPDLKQILKAVKAQ